MNNKQPDKETLTVDASINLQFNGKYSEQNFAITN